MEGNAGTGAKATGYAEIRNGICKKCLIPFEWAITQNANGEDVDIRLPCAKCGGDTGQLLVAFNSGDVEGYWGNEYQAERITYCMKHRRDKIPKHLRTGAKPLISRILGWDVEREAKKLMELNLAEK